MNVLDAAKGRVIAAQMEVVQSEQFFLAGGTGLGLRLGHRVSRDLDWFAAAAFDAQPLARRLGSITLKPTEARCACTTARSRRASFVIRR